MIRSDDTGKLILRLAVGILILLHGIGKITGGVGHISGQLAAHGLPGVLAYGVYIGEIVAPVLVIVGIYTRPAAWIMVVNMVIAIWLAHAKDLTAFGKSGGLALELQYIFLAAALAVAFLGAGRFSVGGNGGRLN
jgi:putative oxidoreductase